MLPSSDLLIKSESVRQACFVLPLLYYSDLGHIQFVLVISGYLFIDEENNHLEIKPRNGIVICGMYVCMFVSA